YGPDAVRRLRLLEAAKRLGFGLDDTKVLLRAADAGTPAASSVRELAARRLAEIETQIARAEATRTWMLAAAGCTCESFAAFALFEADTAPDAHLSRAS